MLSIQISTFQSNYPINVVRGVVVLVIRSAALARAYIAHGGSEAEQTKAKIRVKDSCEGADARSCDTAVAG